MRANVGVVSVFGPGILSGAPGSGQYQLGSPLIKTAVLHLENGKTLTIEAKDQSDKNVYVSKVVLNGRTLSRNYLTYEEITGGGSLTFYMSDKPNL